VTRDPLFYQFFKDLPGCFFQLVKRPASDAEQYEFKAVEYKETAVRLDGVFLPRNRRAGPAYLWEAQYYKSNKVYANIMSKVGRFLEHGDPEQDWVAVVIYPHRSMEQSNLKPYRCIIDSDQLVRIYLDEMPPALPDQFEMVMLEMIAAKPDAALEKVQAMIPRLRASRRPEQFQRTMLQLIETIILYQFPGWPREEVKKMIQITDVREIRVVREALEEQMEAIATKLLAIGRPIDEIVEVTSLTASKVRKLKKKQQGGSRQSKA
jgi:predicted transposase/invertase (TIGR01784 family)